MHPLHAEYVLLQDAPRIEALPDPDMLACLFCLQHQPPCSRQGAGEVPLEPIQGRLFADPSMALQGRVNAWIDEDGPGWPKSPLLVNGLPKSGRSLAVREVVPALLAAHFCSTAGFDGRSAQSQPPRLCVWGGGSGIEAERWARAPRHLQPLLARLEGLRTWAARALPNVVLLRAAPDGSNILAALPAVVQRLAAAAAPGVIVFVEDDWQPEAGGTDAEVAAMWQQLTTQGPRNVVWVLAPQRPLSAWAAMAAAQSLSNSSSSFGDAATVVPLADCLDSTERWAVWSALCADSIRSGEETPRPELLAGAEAAVAGPALLVSLVQTLPLVGAAWQSDAAAFVQECIARLKATALGDWRHGRVSLESTERMALRRLVSDGGTADDFGSLPPLLQTFLRPWIACGIDGLLTARLGCGAQLVEAAMDGAGPAQTPFHGDGGLEDGGAQHPPPRLPSPQPPPTRSGSNGSPTHSPMSSLGRPPLAPTTSGRLRLSPLTAPLPPPSDPPPMPPHNATQGLHRVSPRSPSPHRLAQPSPRPRAPGGVQYIHGVTPRNSPSDSPRTACSVTSATVAATAGPEAPSPRGSEASGAGSELTDSTHAASSTAAAAERARAGRLRLPPVRRPSGGDPMQVEQTDGATARMGDASARASVLGPDDSYSSPAIPEAIGIGISTGVPHLRLVRPRVHGVLATNGSGRPVLLYGKPQASQPRHGGFGGLCEADETGGDNGGRQVTSMRSTLDSWCSTRSSIAANGAAASGDAMFDEIWPWARSEGDQLAPNVAQLHC